MLSASPVAGAVEHQVQATEVNSRDAALASAASTGESGAMDESGISPSSSQSDDHAAHVSLNSPRDATSAPSLSVPVASDSRPQTNHASSSTAFPFFPYVICDPSCCLSTASLTTSLAANDSRLSSAVLDCVLAALNDALQAATHRVYAGGLAVANAPMHADTQHQPAAASASPWQQSQYLHSAQRGDHSSAATSLVAGVQEFVGPLSALSALLSLSDRLVESRVDECLSRLLVLARRVCARRPSALYPPGSSQCINGSEERFLLSFVRCVLQLAANHRPIAAWLKLHAMEFQFLETLYTQARHMTGMQLIKAG